jgi:hypothetical protein
VNKFTKVRVVLVDSITRAGGGRDGQAYYALKKDIEILHVAHKLKGGNPWIPWFKCFFGVVRYTLCLARETQYAQPRVDPIRSDAVLGLLFVVFFG